MRLKNNHYQPITRGFTLLELLIAIAVFAIMSVMAYGGLSSVILNSSQTEKELEKIQKVQRAIFTITRDLTQITNRNIRDEFGNTQPHLDTGGNIDYLVEFTRSGRRNPAKLIRSNLLRVAYKHEDEKLIRIFWSQLDRTQDVEPYEDVLLENVTLAELRYLDDTNEWHTQWPPLSATTSTTAIDNPKAIELKVNLKGWGELTRIYRVTG